MKEREKWVQAGLQLAEGFLRDRHLSKVTQSMILLLLLRAEITKPRCSPALSKSGKTDEEQ